VIEDAPENVTVTEGENLSSIRATTRNTGGITGEGELTLSIDNGSAAGSWGVRLEPGESRTYDFASATPDLDPGTYPFTLRLDGDTHGGTLVVEADPATTTIDDDDPSGTDGGEVSGDEATDTDGNSTASEADGPETGSGNTSDTDGGTDAGGNSDETTNDSAPANETPADGESDSVGMIPLPFGTREAFGGTVLVGAIHLLGHWV
jgi:hypothetical protein